MGGGCARVAGDVMPSAGCKNNKFILRGRLLFPPHCTLQSLHHYHTGTIVTTRTGLKHVTRAQWRLSGTNAERARRRDGRERARRVGASAVHPEASRRVVEPMPSGSMAAGRNRYITKSSVNLTLSKQRPVEAVDPGGELARTSFVCF